MNVLYLCAVHCCTLRKHLSEQLGHWLCLPSQAIVDFVALLPLGLYSKFHLNAAANDHLAVWALLPQCQCQCRSNPSQPQVAEMVDFVQGTQSVVQLKAAAVASREARVVLRPWRQLTSGECIPPLI